MNIVFWTRFQFKVVKWPLALVLTIFACTANFAQHRFLSRWTTKNTMIPLLNERSCLRWHARFQWVHRNSICLLSTTGRKLLVLTSLWINYLLPTFCLSVFCECNQCINGVLRQPPCAYSASFWSSYKYFDLQIELRTINIINLFVIFCVHLKNLR